jgi:hypothetical protein
MMVRYASAAYREWNVPSAAVFTVMVDVIDTMTGKSFPT